MTILQWLNSLRPAIPFSAERPCSAMSGSELRRHLQQGSVLINGERCSADEPMDFPAFSLVFFPNSVSRRTTII